MSEKGLAMQGSLRIINPIRLMIPGIPPSRRNNQPSAGAVSTMRDTGNRVMTFSLIETSINKTDLRPEDRPGLDKEGIYALEPM